MDKIRNPYLVGLTTVTILAALIAVVLLITGGVQSQDHSQTTKSIGTLAAAGTWIGWALLSLLATLVSGAIVGNALAAVPPVEGAAYLPDLKDMSD